ncbi:hypothetical protein BGX26_011560 [Mortierella sp. AD094]|nr:hypothetical protein BGX26_011560 [Mortierella sp. AD094]
MSNAIPEHMRHDDTAIPFHLDDNLELTSIHTDEVADLETEAIGAGIGTDKSKIKSPSIESLSTTEFAMTSAILEVAANNYSEIQQRRVSQNHGNTSEEVNSSASFAFKMSQQLDPDFENGNSEISDYTYPSIKRRSVRTSTDIYMDILELEEPLMNDYLRQGHEYYSGINVPQDYSKAIKQYQMAANQGNVYAQNCLGSMYKKGEGIPQSYSKAMDLYQMAANQGYAGAQYNLGTMYKNGQAARQDYFKAIKLYQRASNQGYAPAQMHLGIMYQNGQGIPQDYSKAIELYQMAADQGDVSAQINLGRMYKNG